MSQNDRQRNLFMAEDFTIPYRAFTQANFTAYDYDSIKNAMHEQIRTNHPENFNDWIRSSEFVMLIEMFAFLGHSLAFRIDMAGRENFLATAERRESVLRIADMLGQTPSRHQPARGLLKITSVRTDQLVHDVAGNDIKDSTIGFEENYENFILVMNKIFNKTNMFGEPNEQAVIGRVRNEIYKLNNVSKNLNDLVFAFNANVNGSSKRFELHGVTINRKTEKLDEVEPRLGNSLNILYKNDNQGNASTGTGFFIGFKQGQLAYRDENFTNPSPNMVIDHSHINVNNSDIWVQELNNNDNVEKLWTKVDSSFGENLSFNNLGNFNRSIYSVKTVENDNVNFVFGDGVFSDLPHGKFRFWVRTGFDQTYSISPSDVGTVSFSFDYRSDGGNIHRATISAELIESVNNATSKENAVSIQRNAGRVFATQNRMVTGADYSIQPFAVSENVKKVKASNRTFTGHGRYLQRRDPTGEYQNVDMIGRDGYIFKEITLHQTNAPISYKSTELNEEQLQEQYIDHISSDPEIMNLFYSEYDPYEEGLNYSSDVGSRTWQHISKGYQFSTGYVTRRSSSDSSPEIQGTNTDNNDPMKYVDVGSIIEFVGEPQVDKSVILGKDANGNRTGIVNGGSGYVSGEVNVEIRGTGTGATATATVAGGSIASISLTNGGTGYYGPVEIVITTSNNQGSGAIITAEASRADTMWARVVELHENGLGSVNSSGRPTGLTERGHGAISLNRVVPNGTRIKRIFPSFKTRFSNVVRNAIVGKLRNSENFGIRYDGKDGDWKIMDEDWMPAYTASEDGGGVNFNLTNAGSTTNDNSWIIRVVKYGMTRWEIITRKTKFVFGSDEEIRFFNNNAAVGRGNTSRDKIIVSSINHASSENPTAIGHDVVFSVHGYFTDSDGYSDNRKIIVSMVDEDNDNYPDNPMAFKTLVNAEKDQIELGTVIENGHKYEVHRYKDSIVPREPIPRVDGRENLTFTYRRVASSNVRIDPSIGNIIDIYVMTKSYDDDFRKWLIDDRTPTTMPNPPSTSDLEKQFADLNSKKSATDSIIQKAARQRILFGELAQPEMRGKFLVVKTTGTSLSDNEIKKRILDAINKFFNIDNWEFGETFYSTELFTYLHKELAGTISSVVINPTHPGSVFGALFQIEPADNELMIPDVSLGDIELVDALTANVLK